MVVPVPASMGHRSRGDCKHHTNDPMVERLGKASLGLINRVHRCPETRLEEERQLDEEIVKIVLQKRCCLIPWRQRQRRRRWERLNERNGHEEIGKGRARCDPMEISRCGIDRSNAESATSTCRVRGVFNRQETKVSNQIVDVRHFFTMVLGKRARGRRYRALLGLSGLLDRQ